MTKSITNPGYALFAILPLAASAVAADSDPAPSAQSQKLQEVIVTATRRATKLEQTPIAITVLDEASISRRRIINLSDVAQSTPGFVFTPLSAQESYPSMRGTTQGNGAAGADLSVTEFIDGVPTTGVGDDNPDLFALKSIQVLRGPQGTLFGQNVTGGAIVIDTLAPSFTPEVRAQATYGNYNLAEVRSYLTGPLVGDELAANVSLQYRRQGGYLNDPYLGTHLLSTSLGSARTQFLWTPSDRLSVLFGADYSHNASPYKAQQLDGNFQPGLFPTLYYGANDADQGTRSFGDARNGGALLRIGYQMGIGTLTSISGLRYVNDDAVFSTSADPENQFIQDALDQDRQWTEEIHLVSPEGRPFTWVTGLFLLDANHRQRAYYNINVVPGTVLSFVPPYSALAFTDDNDQHVTDRSYAAFGQANYAFTPTLKLTLGGRYTVETKSGHSEVTDTSGLSSPLISGPYSHRWTAFTPMVTLSYQPTRQFLTYLTAANGFKSGGYDTSATSDQGLRTPFAPEKVWSYEAGVKASTLNNRLVLNGDVYYADYKDLQVNAYNQALLQYITANAGVAKVPGVELELFAYPTHWLDLTASYSYMGAYYSEYVGTADFSGNHIPFDPTNQFHFGAEAHFLASALGGGTVRVGGDVSYQSDRYFTDGNSDPSFIYHNTGINGLLNVHASWFSPDSTWEVSLWGKNVTNVRYLIYGTDLSVFYENLAEFTSGANDTMYVMNWNRPATYGITVTYNH
jgi:iron complex outermembrane receptor protein